MAKLATKETRLLLILLLLHPGFGLFRFAALEELAHLLQLMSLPLGLGTLGHHQKFARRNLQKPRAAYELPRHRRLAQG